MKKGGVTRLFCAQCSNDLACGGHLNLRCELLNTAIERMN